MGGCRLWGVKQLAARPKRYQATQLFIQAPGGGGCGLWGVNQVVSICLNDSENNIVLIHAIHNVQSKNQTIYIIFVIHTRYDWQAYYKNILLLSTGVQSRVGLWTFTHIVTSIFPYLALDVEGTLVQTTSWNIIWTVKTDHTYMCNDCVYSYEPSHDKINKQIQWIFVPRLWNLFWGVLSLADKRIAPWMAVSRLPRQRSRSDTQPHFKSEKNNWRKKSILMQDIWQMMQHMKCGQKGQLAFPSCWSFTWNSMKMGQLRFKICFTWNLEEIIHVISPDLA